MNARMINNNVATPEMKEHYANVSRGISDYFMDNFGLKVKRRPKGLAITHHYCLTLNSDLDGNVLPSYMTIDLKGLKYATNSNGEHFVTDEVIAHMVSVIAPTVNGISVAISEKSASTVKVTFHDYKTHTYAGAWADFGTNTKNENTLSVVATEAQAAPHEEDLVPAPSENEGTHTATPPKRVGSNPFDLLGN